MSILFEPKDIGKMEVKNRFVRSATAEGAADETGLIADKLFDIYRNLAEGGVGLIITGHAYVQPNGRCTPDQMGIYKDDLLSKLKELSSEVHRASPDCRVAVQITHAGRQVLRGSVREPVAPSAVTDTRTGVTPREMTEAEIEECMNSFADAAERTRLAGFDAVQIHSAHGYLISSFNSPHTNLRTDKWGGNLENRMRFLMETYRRVRTKVGDDYPVLVKLNAADFLDGGIEIDESVQIAKALSAEGIDAIEISGSMFESYKGKGTARTRIRKPEQEAYFLPYAERIKKAVGDVPVILVGGIRSVSVMERIISEGNADFISMSRPLIREPDLPDRIRDGKQKADCISCNGCMSSRVDVIRCVQLSKK
jgi:2,4-dienoyl-CoA reductase-like NADH-dependent reductase (Old Yellow Enzyme family)